MNGNLVKVLSMVPTTYLVGALTYSLGWFWQLSIISAVAFAQYELVDRIMRRQRNEL